jgi:TetR/AcrR family tetracycline transcriptional repressor
VGVKAPSLYWHFKDKSALMSAVMERIFGECLDSVPDHDDWQEWMRAFGKVLWRTQGMVRDFGRLITTTDMDIDQLQRTTRRIRKRLQAFDLPESDAMEMQSTIQALMTGWSGFARAPYSHALAKTLDFDKLAMRGLDALIEGKASELALRGARGASAAQVDHARAVQHGRHATDHDKFDAGVAKALQQAVELAHASPCPPAPPSARIRVLPDAAATAFRG